jgi:hypothetical protein
MAWIVFNCTAGSEFTVRDRLVNDLGFEIIVPVYRKQIRPHRVRKLRTLMLPATASLYFSEFGRHCHCQRTRTVKTALSSYVLAITTQRLWISHSA